MAKDHIFPNLPGQLKKMVSQSIEVAISKAEESFLHNQPDEDRVSGDLNGKLIDYSHGSFESNGRKYVYRTVGVTVSHRAEKQIGADGFIETWIYDVEAGTYSVKGLPYQAKKDWSGSDRRLFDQARRIQSEIGGGIIIDYTDQGYSAVDTNTVLRADGNRNNVNPESVKDLTEILAEKYLSCVIGQTGMFYDMATGEVIKRSRERSLTSAPFRIRELIKSDIFILK